MGILMKAMKNNKKSIEYLEKAAEIYVKNYGENYSFCCKIFRILGDIYDKMGAMKKGYEYHIKSKDQKENLENYSFLENEEKGFLYF